ncbi:MAG: polyprenyl synthetase family protein [Thermodesulfobacteriota bacterium]
MNDLSSYLAGKREIVDRALKTCLPPAEGPAADLILAMTYSLFAGGKRLRPILCIAGAEAVGGDGHDVLPAACALEMIHTYSLIHDDLPVMDDDDLRRGKPTNHKVFGEAVALLAGDGLLTEAFGVLAGMKPPEGTPPAALLRVLRWVSKAAGCQGMVGGQVVDIQSEKEPADAEMVKYIHTHKTADLLTVSVVSGAILCNCNETMIQALAGYGRRIGLAFQISDDILNIEGDRSTLGKDVGSDEERGKMTWPAAYGFEESKKIREDLVTAGIESLLQLDHRADPLRAIARYIIERRR